MLVTSGEHHPRSWADVILLSLQEQTEPHCMVALLQVLIIHSLHHKEAWNVLKSPCWWVIFNTGCCCPPLTMHCWAPPQTFTPKQTQSLHLCSHKHLCCHVRGSSSNLQTGAIKKREVQEVMLPFPKYISFLHLYIKIQVPVYRIACSLQNIGSGYKQDYTYAGTKVTTAAACRTMIRPLLKQVEAAQPTKQKTVWKEMGASWTEESNAVLSK